MRRQIVYGVLLATAIALAMTFVASATSCDATISISVRDPFNPCSLYKSTGHSFYVMIWTCNGEPLIYNGVDYGAWPPQFLLTETGPAGGRVRGEVRVPPGCYMIAGIAGCKNVFTQIALVDAGCGDEICVNLLMTTFQFCTTLQQLALFGATVDPEPGEERVAEVFPRETRALGAALEDFLMALPPEETQLPILPSLGDLTEWIELYYGPKPCCGEATPGGVSFDFLGLPYLNGALPSAFSYHGVGFTSVWGDFVKENDTLWIVGQEESGGVWFDAEAYLDFASLPCGVCSLTVRADPHGPPTAIEAVHADYTTQVVTLNGNGVQTAVLQATDDNPFVSATIVGQETQVYLIVLE